MFLPGNIIQFFDFFPTICESRRTVMIGDGFWTRKLTAYPGLPSGCGQQAFGKLNPQEVLWPPGHGLPLLGDEGKLGQDPGLGS